MNVDSFRVINRYNGMKFKFDVYLDKVDPITPKISNGKMNNFLQLTDSCRAYYEETTEKNGLEVQVEVKKHNKKLLFEAIQSQLMYLPNIKVYVKTQGSLSYTTMDIAAKELYRDENIIISESTVFDKPHILLGTGKALINYGFIAFNELEIEPKRGAVGFILDVNDVEVTPSREALVWSAKTRKAVLEAYDRVSLTAAKFVNDSLSSEHDYLEWMVKAAQTMSAIRVGNNSSVIGRLASIIDSAAIGNVKYPLDTKVEFSNKVTEMIGSKLTARKISYDRYTKKITRDAIVDVGAFALPVYFTEGKADHYVDRYLSDTIGSFVLIQPKETELYKGDYFAKLVLSSAKIQKYDDTKVPDDIMEAYLAGEEDATEDDPTVNTVDRSAVRKANAQIVVHKITKSYRNYVFSAYDTSISDIPSLYDPSEVSIYGNGNDRTDMKTIANMFPHKYLACYNDWRTAEERFESDGMTHTYAYFYKDAKPINMVVVAKENAKYFANSSKYKTLYEFVVADYDNTSGHLTLSNDIRSALTAAVLNKLFYECDFNSAFKSDSVKLLFPEEYEQFVSLYNGWMAPSYCGIDNPMNDPFYKACADAHLAKIGIANPDDLSTHLETISKELPEFMCETIDEINSIDSLCEPQLMFWIDFINKVRPFIPLIELYSKKYFYNDGIKATVAAQLKEYLDSKL